MQCNRLLNRKFCIYSHFSLHFLLIITILYSLYYILNKTKYDNIEMVDISHSGDIENENMIVSINTAHQENLPHRGLWILIFDYNKQHLLFLKRNKQHKTCSNSWSFLGEHTKPNENYIDTALRGLNEELQITKNDLLEIRMIPEPMIRLHLYYPIPNRTDNQWTKGFIAILKKDTTVIPNSNECDEYQWIPVIDTISWISLGCNHNKCQHSCIDATNIYSHSKDLINITYYASFNDLLIYYIKIAIKHLSVNILIKMKIFKITIR